MDIKTVYNNISKEFSRTRYKVWPQVGEFIDSFDINSFNGDIGSGNGKNMLHRKNVKFIGLDNSIEFIKICQEKNLEVVEGSILNIPFKNNFLDNTICIAVIHHFKERTDRIQAIKELIRITKPTGKILIYVWAFEQPVGTIRKFTEQDTLVPFNSRNSGIYYRFYHVYKESELEREILEANGHIIKSYYDNGNWCCIIQKK